MMLSPKSIEATEKFNGVPSLTLDVELAEDGHNIEAVIASLKQQGFQELPNETEGPPSDLTTGKKGTQNNEGRDRHTELHRAPPQNQSGCARPTLLDYLPCRTQTPMSRAYAATAANTIMRQHFQDHHGPPPMEPLRPCRNALTAGAKYLPITKEEQTAVWNGKQNISKLLEEKKSVEEALKQEQKRLQAIEEQLKSQQPLTKENLDTYGLDHPSSHGTAGSQLPKSKKLGLQDDAILRAYMQC